MYGLITQSKDPGTTGGTITINGGTVTASSMIGAGIGGGAYGKASNIPAA